MTDHAERDVQLGCVLIKSRLASAAWLMSATRRFADSNRTSQKVRKGPMLLQKSFWDVEQKFLEPLMRFARDDVRDHID
jgi:hypothetical protein